jgi:hypothetical protein
MRLGPGRHLKGLTLMGGIVKPEEFDYFHEVCNFNQAMGAEALPFLDDYHFRDRSSWNSRIF